MRPTPIKILYFIQLPPPVHGVSTINALIYNSKIANEGINKSLLEIKFSQNLLELRRINFSKIREFVVLSRKLNNVLRLEKPDYVYFSFMPVGIGFWRDLFFVWTIRRRRSCIIFHLHNRGISEQARFFVRKILYRYVFSDSLVIHLSKGLMDREIIPLRIPGVRTVVIPNGISVNHSSKSIYRASKLKLLFYSNLFPSKGIYDLVDIVCELFKKRNDISLRIAGDFMREEFRKELVKLIHDKGLNDIVSIVGPKYGTEKIREYLAADVFVFPSYFRQECSPLVLLEAMNCQLPIVSSNIGAIPEMIEHGTEGILVASRDIMGFVKAILSLADDQEKREKMGLAAREKFLRAYTQDTMEMNYRDVLKKDIEGRI